MTVRIIVTGGRDYEGQQEVFDALTMLHERKVIAELAHGATPTENGADWHAHDWAKMNCVTVRPYPARVEIDGKWPGAGPRRNQRMLDEFKPDGVVAFPGGAGTADMVDRAKKAGVNVWFPVKNAAPIAN